MGRQGRSDAGLQGRHRKAVDILKEVKLIGTRLTLGEMKDGLIGILKDSDISPGASILWADMCNEGDKYMLEGGAVPGSVLLGVEYIHNGKLIRGTIQLQPPKIGTLN